MSKLLPCPFCGGEAEIEYEGVDGYYQKYYSWVHVVCKNCYATTGRTYDDKDRSKAYAIRAWNTRKPMQEIVERLEEKSDNIPIQYEYNYDQGFDDGICYSIDIVEEVGGMN